MLHWVTLCYTVLHCCTVLHHIILWVTLTYSMFIFPLQKLLDTMYSDTPELRGTRADPEYLQSNLLGNGLVSFPAPFPSSCLGLGMRLGQVHDCPRFSPPMRCGYEARFS